MLWIFDWTYLLIKLFYDHCLFPQWNISLAHLSILLVCLKFKKACKCTRWRFFFVLFFFGGGWGSLKTNHYSKHIEHLFTLQLLQLCVFDDFMLLIGAEELNSGYTNKKVEIIENMVAYEILRYAERGQEEKIGCIWLRSHHFTQSFHPLVHPPSSSSVSPHMQWVFIFQIKADKHMFSTFRGAHLMQRSLICTTLGQSPGQIK